jgi:hypothetical protein
VLTELLPPAATTGRRAPSHRAPSSRRSSKPRQKA